MVRARSDSQRQRRFLLRRATSVSSLLSLYLNTPSHPDIQHAFPITPSEAVRLLTLLAAGNPVEELLNAAEGG